MTVIIASNGKATPTTEFDAPTIWWMQYKPEVGHYLACNNSPLGYEFDEIINLENAHYDTCDIVAAITFTETWEDGFEWKDDYKTFNREWVARQRAYYKMTEEIEVPSFHIS